MTEIRTVTTLVAKRDEIERSIPSTVKQHMAALEELGGLDVLGSHLTDNMYHAGWARAGSAPYKGTKLLALHFGGTRNPMAVRWPAKIAPDAAPRAQFHHVNDIVSDNIRACWDHAAAHGEWCRARSDRRFEFRLYLRGLEGQGPSTRAILRDHREPSHLPRRLDRMRDRAETSMGPRSPTRHSRVDAGQRRVGTL